MKLDIKETTLSEEYLVFESYLPSSTKKKLDPLWQNFWICAGPIYRNNDYYITGTDIGNVKQCPIDVQDQMVVQKGDFMGW